MTGANHHQKGESMDPEKLTIGVKEEDKPMKKTYVLQMQAHPWTPWVVAREYDTLAEAWDAYDALTSKTGYRVAEAYTVVRYKPVKEATR